MALLVVALMTFGAVTFAQEIRIVNHHGSVTVEVRQGESPRIRRLVGGSPSQEGLRVSESELVVQVETSPAEDGDADIEAHVPLGTDLSVETEDGDIRLKGVVRQARLMSNKGSLEIEAPLNTTHLIIESAARPGRVDVSDGYNLGFLRHEIAPRYRVWRLSNELRSPRRRYGRIEALLNSPPSVTLRDWAIPDDWPVKPHFRATEVVDKLLALKQRRVRGRAVPPPGTRRPAATDQPPAALSQGGATFVSDVRMVSMSVAVSDADGRPLEGLAREDFTVEEDGVEQDIRVADPEEAPFNMVILLDLSASTRTELEHMRQATLQLITLAGAHDRVAVHAMAGNMFHRLVPLTADRELLAQRSAELPAPWGGSPLWDSIALSYEQDLAAHPGERNALIVISDGIDGRISDGIAPSDLSPRRLLQAADELDARIYPVLLLSGERYGRRKFASARERMTALAAKTGGRLFTARSIADIRPVLPQLAWELRSVYEIAYYPENQNFDRSWREVKIRVKRPGVKVSARRGYFAQ